MMRSLYSGVAGLKNHQVRMDVIGNNIANVNTYGFKSSRVVFQDIFSQTTKSASAPNGTTVGGTSPMQIGLGVNLAAIDIIHSNAAPQLTGGALDLAIDGDGYFIVRMPTGENMYTRLGNLYVDESGNLLNSTGNFLQGLQNISIYMIQEGVSAQPPSTDNPAGVPARPAQFIYMPKVNANGQLVDASGAELVDAAGDPIAIPSPSDPDYEAKRAAAMEAFMLAAQDPAYPKQLFDPYTLPANLVDPADPALTVPNQAYSLFFNAATGKLRGEFQSVTGIDPELYQLKDADQPFAYDNLSGQLKKDAVAQAMTDINLNGYNNVSIDDNGIIRGMNSRGEMCTVAVIALANFSNPSGLEKQGNSLYAQTSNTGDPVIGQAQSGNLGKISAGALEMSNVDLANEFTDMIVTQRGFQANSRIITTADSLLEELVNLKR